MIRTPDHIPPEERYAISDEELAEIGTILSLRRGFSLSAYKDACMKRRIAMRMRSARCEDAGDYCALLRQSDQELDLLQKTLTIHVSQFFRNPSMYQFLCAEALPRLFTDLGGSRSGPFRFWCMGCAGGEEPYSLAILLREHFAPVLENPGIVIRATDIDQETLDAARRGDYQEDRLRELSQALRERYFLHEGGRFRIATELRAMLQLERGDILLTDRYQPVDLVLCRNTLIYLGRPDQERILLAIAANMASGGILVLGKSEMLTADTRRLFVPLSASERIYRRNETRTP